MYLNRNSLLLSAALIAGGGAAGAETEIRFARFFGSCDADFAGVTDPSGATNECGVITALTNQFNEANPDIEVVTEIVEWQPYYEALSGRIASGDVPDVSVMHTDVLGEFARRGLIEPIGDGLAEHGVRTEDFVEIVRDTVVIDDKLYALPQDIVGWLMHMNVALMEQAGLASDGTPNVPSSLGEFREIAQKFVDQTGMPYLAIPIDAPSAARLFYSLVWQQGGEMFPAGKTQISLQSEEAKAALRDLLTLEKDGLVSFELDSSTATSNFQQGKVGALLQGTWMIAPFLAAAQNPDMALSSYAVVPQPQFYDEPALFYGGHTWTMLKDENRTEAERDAALKFIAFLHDRAGDWARTGHLPTRFSVLESDAFKELPQREYIAAYPDNARSMPSDVPAQRVLFFTIGEEISAGLSGQKNVEDALAQAEDRANRILMRASR